MDIFRFPEGISFLFRWGHFLFGITWIGMLYYFNFVQGAYFAEAEASAKTDATKKLVPRALWYFRWGAMGTLLTGLVMLLLLIHVQHDYLTTAKGMLITTGALLGITMFLNVWLVIWPRQKMVIAAANGEKVENLPVLARRAFLASRTNTLFSVPMLFFMGATSHLPLVTANPGMAFYAAAIAIIVLLELHALLASNGPTTKAIEKPVAVIHSGLVLTIVFYVLLVLL